MNILLEREIEKYTRRGYRVISKGDSYAQLVKPKQFSFFWALMWFLLFGVGLLIYLFYYWGKKDDTLYLRVTQDGRIRASKN